LEALPTDDSIDPRSDEDGFGDDDSGGVTVLRYVIDPSGAFGTGKVRRLVKSAVPSSRPRPTTPFTAV